MTQALTVRCSIGLVLFLSALDMSVSRIQDSQSERQLTCVDCSDCSTHYCG